MKRLTNLLKADAVCVIAVILASVSLIFSPDRMAAFQAIDRNTLILLFCLMLTTEGLREMHFFRHIATWILEHVRTERGVGMTLILLCFFGSMIMTNDVALLTFVPFGLFLLEVSGLERRGVFLMIFMTIAANLGSVLTPIGNPQNLYLFERSGLTVPQFLRLTSPYVIFSGILLVRIAGITLKSQPAEIRMKDEPVRGNPIVYLILFFLCLSSVAGLLAESLLLVLVSFTVLLLRRSLFRRPDYVLLLTFTAFFIFIGNLNQLSTLRKVIETSINGYEVPVAAGVSQIISNVPTAILLSSYTDRIPELIVGTNLGGPGTLIASMASLITYKAWKRKHPGTGRKYLLQFSIRNVVFLALLSGFRLLIH